MTAGELRKKFLDFMESKGHKIIPSASLIPKDELSAIQKTHFTTAGMQQFKEHYLNPGKSENSRVATIQKCVRTSDIDEVGDETHLTFFEMLGNFSFGYPDKQNSYFKKEAINYAWEFLTEVLEIRKNRIHATYFKGEKGVDEDMESKSLLKKIEGLEKSIPQGFKDNFWSLGTENSPGGPTIEFYVDGIEVWNCVFNEYVFKNGNYEPADKKGVDTGMGLERLLAVLNNKENIFETELFRPIIEKIEEISGKKYKDNKKEFRIIADHIKATTFIIADGVMPSNVQRGYVLRRLIRRAIRYGKLINIENNFTNQIAETVVEIYKGTYDELENNKILAELEREENKFRKTLENGLREFDKLEVKIKSDYEKDKQWTYIEKMGEIAFNFYQSYGFPIEIFIEELEKRHIEYMEDKKRVIEEFKKRLGKHQELSRTASAGMFKGGLADTKEKTTQLHTAAHLMLAGLRKVLGPHVHQKGSNINGERVRFDFSHPEKMTDEQKKAVEDFVNSAIDKKIPVELTEMSPDEARAQGAEGEFNHKYGDRVKVYSIEGYSKEICGGPHVKNTADIKGRFKIQKEESSSVGVRRIKAAIA